MANRDGCMQARVVQVSMMPRFLDCTVSGEGAAVRKDPGPRGRVLPRKSEEGANDGKLLSEGDKQEARSWRRQIVTDEAGEPARRDA